MWTIIVGKFPSHTCREMERAAHQAGASCVFTRSTEEAVIELRSAEEAPVCIFVTCGELLQQLIATLKGSLEFGVIPIVAITPYPSEKLYRDSLRAGADDCITEGEGGGIFRRVANVAGGSAARMPGPIGRVLVAVEEEHARRTVGRRLLSAGYQVEFAAGEDELREKARGSAPTMVVASSSFPSIGAVGAIQLVRSAADSQDIPGVVLPIHEAEQEPADGGGESEMGSRLMFLVDEARSAGLKDARASRRLQHSLICTFRSARSFQPMYALTDNISREGMYLRTLDPPNANTEVLIEMLSDKGEILHLKGVVAWRYVPVKTGGIKPAGFGLRLNPDACSLENLTEYRRFYDSRLAVLMDSEHIPARSREGEHVTVPAAPQRTPRSDSTHSTEIVR